MFDKTVQLTGWDQVTRLLQKLSRRNAISVLRTAMGVRLRLIQTELRQRWLTGGTADDKLATRTGNLKRSVRVGTISTSGDGVRGGINAGTRYAYTHMGKRGSSVTIRGKPWLTIPMTWIPESAKALAAKSGAVRGGARSGAFANTFVRKSNAGNLIIFGRGTYAKGAHTGEGRGGVVPLFLLKRQVKIKRRVFLDEILRAHAKQFSGDVRKVLLTPKAA